MHRIGGPFVAAMAVLLLAVAGNAAFAQQQKTYRCKIADVVSWDGRDGDGRLQPDSNPTDYVRQIYDGAIIDTLTGAVTYANGHRELWSVIKRGDDDRGNDYMLTNVRQDVPLAGAMIGAVNQFIRIRTWGGKPTQGSAGELVWPKGATPRFLASSLPSPPVPARLCADTPHAAAIGRLSAP